MKNAGIKWTPELVEEFKAFVPGHNEREIRQHFMPILGFEMTEGQLGNAKRRYGVKSGTDGGRFVKGTPSPFKNNRTPRVIPPESLERMKRSQFKSRNEDGTFEGQRRTKDREVGSERISKDGYVEVKVDYADRDRHNGQWIPKHRLIWEREHGRKLQKGEIVRFKDGDKSNFSPDNLVLVTQQENLFLQKLPVDSQNFDVCHAVAKLRSEVSDAKHRGVCPCCGQEFRKEYLLQSRCRKCIDSGAKIPREKRRSR